MSVSFPLHRPSPRRQKAIMARVLASLLLCLAALLGAPSDAGAQTCFPNQCGYSSCHTPAAGVTSQLWGELQPADTGQLPANRDSTDFRQIVGSWVDNPYWMSVDPENGYVFAVGSQRFQIWEATATPGQPVLKGDVSLPNMGLTWGFDAHAFIIFQDVDAPPGRNDLVAMVGENGVGLVVWNTTNKATPVILYQDHGPGSPPQREANQVYATTINGRHYAFVAASADGGGLHVYDLSAAQLLTSRCTEGQPGGSSACPDVYLRQIGTRTVATNVDGAGNFIVVSSGGNPSGFEIWNVADPNSPQLVMNALPADPVYGVALWQQGTSYYLAVRTSTQGRTYNVSCITSGSCSLGTALWSRSMPFSVSGQVTDSLSGSTPFLYFGMGEDCLSGTQNEWLYNASTPSSPIDITPPGTTVHNGETTSYWGWYYRRNGVHGYNFMAPRMGKFAGEYFYRAAKAIFDIHRRVGGVAPTAGFTWSPSQIYPNTPVNFTDQSTGGPTMWDWTFSPDGSPSFSTTQHPSGVTFGSAGTKTVSLTASNAVGPDTHQANLTVLPPAPAVSGATVTPNPGLICQPITFTATGATGAPPLTFSWEVSEVLVGGNQVVASGSGNPWVWNTDGNTDAGTYVASVQVSNGSGNAGATTPLLILADLPDLPTPSSFAPTYSGQPNALPTGNTQLSVNATGATEWSWDFGTGGGYGPWLNDPVAGPNPIHNYTAAGTYLVRVRVRNCQQALVESAATTLVIFGDPPQILTFDAGAGAFCSGLGCIGDAGVPITFNQTFSGAIDTYEYDWDNNGTFEQRSTSPVTTHAYPANGIFQPTLRVRNGLATTSRQLSSALTISGGSTVTPPAAPAGTSASGSSTSAIELSWGNVDSESGFRVYRQEPGAPFGLLAELGANLTTHSDSPVSNGVQYCYLVTAYNNGGESAASNMSCSMAVPLDTLFADGFESGDLSAWTASTP